VREHDADADDDARIAAVATNSLPFTTTTAPHSQAPGTNAAMAEALKKKKKKKPFL
jgi:hypothetical protein